MSARIMTWDTWSGDHFWGWQGLIAAHSRDEAEALAGEYGTVADLVEHDPGQWAALVIADPTAE